jgi:thymidylate synthase
MNNIDKQYQALLQDILDNGVEKKDRTGTGTISVFGRQIRHKMSEGFPLLTTKKMAWKSMVTELLWFLRGDTNIKYLVDNGCNIWNGDAYKKYENHTLKQREFQKKRVQELRKQGKRLKVAKIELLSKEEFINKIKTDNDFAREWGELGPIYGKQWREWKTYKHKMNYEPYLPVNTDGKVECYVENIDQIANLINDLKTNPYSRRLMVNAWNVGELDQMVLPPCHYGFQVYTRELSLEERIRIYALEEGQTYEEFVTNWNTDEQWLEDLSDTNIPTRAISLMWSQRSVDTFLGLPFNIASYGLLLEIIAKEVNMVPDELIGNLGDVHLYSNHIEQAKEQIGRELSLDERSFIAGSNHSEVSQNIKMFVGIDEDSTLHRHLDNLIIPTRTREPYPLPKLIINDEFWNPDDSMLSIEQVKHMQIDDFILDGYQSHPTIKAPLSN